MGHAMARINGTIAAAKGMLSTAGHWPQRTYKATITHAAFAAGMAMSGQAVRPGSRCSSSATITTNRPVKNSRALVVHPGNSPAAPPSGRCWLRHQAIRAQCNLRWWATAPSGRNQQTTTTRRTLHSRRTLPPGCHRRRCVGYTTLRRADFSLWAGLRKHCGKKCTPL